MRFAALKEILLTGAELTALALFLAFILIFAVA